MNFFSMKEPQIIIGAKIAAAIAVIFFVWEAFFGLSPSAARVLDTRITFKYTAYQDKDQYFISCSLENTKKKKIKAVVRVQLGEESLGGRVFRTLKAQNDSIVLEPLETKAFVTQIDIAKKKNGKYKELSVLAKVKRVSRF